MKNILNDVASRDLHGRLLATIDFLDEGDVRGRDVADIGCGYGWFPLVVRDLGASTVAGVEISFDDLGAARTGPRDDCTHFAVATGDALPFADRAFDTVTAWEVIEHVPRSKEGSLFDEAARLLRPGGIFYLSTPNRSVVANASDPAWWFVGHRHYSISRLSELAAKSGLTPVATEVRGGWWTAVAIVDMYVAKWVFRRPPFFVDFLHRRQDYEYMQTDGFYNVFMKFLNPHSETDPTP